MKVVNGNVILKFVVGFSLAVATPVLAHEHGQHHHDAGADLTPTAPLKGASVYQIQSTWIDNSGKTAPLERFRGKPLVFAMAYTSCKAACPILVNDMQQIEKALPAGARRKVNFALFSFDSKKDSPARLKEYADQHGLDLSQWTLLKSNASAVRELAAVLGVRYKESADGDISHSNVITVLNAEGEIVHQHIGLKMQPKETVQIIQRLVDSK